MKRPTLMSHPQVGHITVSDVIFIAPASSGDYFVPFKFERPCQQTNMIDTNNINCTDVWIVRQVSRLKLSFLYSPLSALMASFALHYISYYKDLSSKQNNTLVYGWYMQNNSLMSVKQELSDAKARHVTELINTDKGHCKLICDIGVNMS